MKNEKRLQEWGKQFTKTSEERFKLLDIRREIYAHQMQIIRLEKQEAAQERMVAKAEQKLDSLI